MSEARIAIDYGPGLARFRAALDRLAEQVLRPPPLLSVSAWAAEHAVLSPETSAQAGRFRAFGYQTGIMDAVSDPSVDEVVVMKSARVGFTKCLDNVVGYFIEHDPAPVLVVLPRVEDAEDYSRTEIAPMLRDTPVLTPLAGDLKARDSRQRIAKRLFTNGSSVSFVGANSPGGFRRITARVVLFDEVDGYPVQGAGLEGDQLALGRKRAESYWNKKVLMGSTPTVKGVSRIEKAYAMSDMRVYHVPCPHCGAEQPIRWRNIKWDAGKPETAHLVCEVNGCIIDEAEKPGMIDAGHWVATAPFNGIAGFHIWAGYSLFPNASWAHLATEWLRVQGDPALLRTFVNLVLGETWEEASEKIDPASIQARAADWPADKVPDGVLVVVAGADVQADRIEATRVGFGIGEEAFILEHAVLYGDPSGPAIWEELEKWRLEPVHTAGGRALATAAMAIDANFMTQTVSAWTLKSHRRGPGRVYAVRGRAGEGVPAWPKRAFRRKDSGANIFTLGVDTLKDVLFARLRLVRPGPGYLHFHAGLDAEYFRQLGGEAVRTTFKKGFPVREYVPVAGRRNEALDCLCYAMAALVALRVNWPAVQAFWQRERPAPVVQYQPQAADDADDAPLPAPEPVRIRGRRSRRRVVRSRFLN